MRSIATLHPTESIPAPPDTVQTMLIAASSGQAMDWPSGSSVGAIVRFSGQTTAGVSMNFEVNLFSTMAAAPTTNSTRTTEGSSGFAHTIVAQGAFQIPGGSTGWSAAGLSSGYIKAEFWKKGG